MSNQQDDKIHRVIQNHNGQILGYLVRFCGNFDDAEDICQDVMVAALTHWRRDGLPENPLAWLYTTARNRSTDWFRSHAVARRVAEPTEQQREPEPVEEALLDKVLEDDLLRLMFTCCHPALADDVRVPLTLKLITGLSLEEVAHAFLVSPRAMEQRLVRAKHKIQSAGIAYEIPTGKQLDARVDSVMQTLYLMFNEGYFATSGASLLRRGLCLEAIRLTTLMQRLFPGRAELISLLALMLLQDSRSQARVSSHGQLVLLEDQQRDTWDQRAIAQGCALIDKALMLRQAPGQYQLQASIAALHAQAKTPAETDWPQITLLYERLMTLAYTEVLHLNYAVAIAMSGRVTQALAELAQIESALKKYFPFYCARADFHRRNQNPAAAHADYDRALTLTNNESEQQFVMAKLRQLDTDEPTSKPR